MRSGRAREDDGGVRVLFTSLPGIGHLHPLLPLARGLTDRGHEVAFAVSEPFRADVAAAGFDDHHPVGAAWTTSELPVRFPELGAIPPGPARYEHARAHVFAGALALDVIDDLTRLIEAWRPDVVVRDAAEFGGYLAAERCGIPHVMVRTDSGSALYSERHVVAASLDAVRARIGLSPDPDAEHPFDHLQLSAAPPIMDDPAPARPPTWHHVRPTLELEPVRTSWPGSTGWAHVVRWCTPRSGPSTADPTCWRRSSPRWPASRSSSSSRPDPSTRRRSGRSRRTSTSPAGSPRATCSVAATPSSPMPASARWPPRLAHGVPLVMLPISADQPMNAQRAATNGLGITLAPVDRTVGDIRTAVRAVLTDPSYASAASAAAAQAAAQPPLDHALDLVEALVAAPAVSCIRC